MKTQISVPLGDRSVTVYELDIGQMRAYLRSEELQPVADQSVDAWDSVIEAAPGITLTMLYATTDLQPADLDKVSISEVAAIVRAVKEANPGFFGTVDRLRAARASFIAQLEASAKPESDSSETSPLSSVTATPPRGLTH